MKPRSFFITGTDTEVGKTWISCQLLRHWGQQGLRTLAMKPVASGCQQAPNGILHNDDALALQQSMSVTLDYHRINPVALKAAVAPHIAARQQGVRIFPDQLVQHCRHVLQNTAYDIALIEGAGGWRVPLDGKKTWEAVVQPLKIPVVLVVAIRLGCINHALLTSQAIVQDGVPLAGWIANRIDLHTSAYEDNLSTLQKLMPAPLLGFSPFCDPKITSSMAPYIALTPKFDALLASG